MPQGTYVVAVLLECNYTSEIDVLRWSCRSCQSFISLLENAEPVLSCYCTAQKFNGKIFDEFDDSSAIYSLVLKEVDKD